MPIPVASPQPLPSIALDLWRETRDRLHEYVQVVGDVRKHHAPHHPHWWHASLRVSSYGLTTTPLSMDDGRQLELVFDFSAGHLNVVVRESAADGAPDNSTNSVRVGAVALDGRPSRQFADSLARLLQGQRIEPGFNPEAHETETEDTRATPARAPIQFDRAAARNWWQTVLWLSSQLESLTQDLPGETGPVQLWPHHFDLATTWFSGRWIPDADPDDPDNGREQMAFGFSSGDTVIDDPYLYVTAYPWAEGLAKASLPAPGRWVTDEWQGAVLEYESLRQSADPVDLVQGFFRSAHSAGTASLQSQARAPVTGDAP